MKLLEMITATLVAALLALLALPAFADEEFQQTLETCSVSAVSNYRILEGYLADVPLEKARLQAGIPVNADVTYSMVEDIGVGRTYLMQLISYRQCSIPLLKAKPKGQLEGLYSACANDSVMRTNILIDIDSGKEKMAPRAKIPKQYIPWLDVFQRVAQEESFAKAAMMASRTMVDCVQKVMKETR